MEQDLLLAAYRKFRKSLKTKMTGKTAGDFHRMGRGNPGLRHLH
jgi:hypothetical protein